jgi:hypothetical protein
VQRGCNASWVTLPPTNPTSAQEAADDEVRSARN